MQEENEVWERKTVEVTEESRNSAVKGWVSEDCKVQESMLEKEK